jgi:hypothetical protein
MPAEGLAVLLRSFRLPTLAALWEERVARAEREHWGYKRLLQPLCESAAQDRGERKVARLLHESGLPDGKTSAVLILSEGEGDESGGAREGRANRGEELRRLGLWNVTRAKRGLTRCGRVFFRALPDQLF